MNDLRVMLIINNQKQPSMNILQPIILPDSTFTNLNKGMSICRQLYQKIKILLQPLIITCQQMNNQLQLFLKFHPNYYGPIEIQFLFALSGTDLVIRSEFSTQRKTGLLLRSQGQRQYLQFTHLIKILNTRIDLDFKFILSKEGQVYLYGKRNYLGFPNANQKPVFDIIYKMYSKLHENCAFIFPYFAFGQEKTQISQKSEQKNIDNLNKQIIDINNFKRQFQEIRKNRAHATQISLSETYKQKREELQKAVDIINKNMRIIKRKPIKAKIGENFEYQIVQQKTLKTELDSKRKVVVKNSSDVKVQSSFYSVFPHHDLPIMSGISIRQNVLNEQKIESEGCHSQISIGMYEFQVMQSVNPIFDFKPKKQHKTNLAQLLNSYGTKAEIPSYNNKVLDSYQTNSEDESIDSQAVTRNKYLRSYLVKKLPRNRQASMISFSNELCILNWIRSSKCESIGRYFQPLQKNALFMPRYKQTLQKLIQKQTEGKITLTLKHKLRLCEKILIGVNFLSNRYICHRDLKPGNIMISSNLHPKIIDFGSACESYGKNNIQNLDKRLLATEAFHKSYKGCPEIIRNMYKKWQYQQHLLFDSFSVGRIFYCLFFANGLTNMNHALSMSGRLIIQNIKYMINACCEINPDDRLTPQQMLKFTDVLINIASRSIVQAK